MTEDRTLWGAVIARTSRRKSWLREAFLPHFVPAADVFGDCQALRHGAAEARTVRSWPEILPGACPTFEIAINWAVASHDATPVAMEAT